MLKLFFFEIQLQFFFSKTIYHQKCLFFIHKIINSLTSKIIQSIKYVVNKLSLFNINKCFFFCKVKVIFNTLKTSGGKVDKFCRQVRSLGNAEKRPFSSQLARAARKETAHTDTPCQLQTLFNNGSQPQGNLYTLLILQFFSFLFK